jgi:hypothetical protein
MFFPFLICLIYSIIFGFSKRRQLILVGLFSVIDVVVILVICIFIFLFLTHISVVLVFSIVFESECFQGWLAFYHRYLLIPSFALFALVFIIYYVFLHNFCISVVLSLSSVIILFNIVSVRCCEILSVFCLVI